MIKETLDIALSFGGSHVVQYTPLVGLGSLGLARANVIFDEIPGRTIDKSSLHKLTKLTLPSGVAPTVDLNKELISLWDLCKDCMCTKYYCSCKQNTSKRKLSTKEADKKKLAALHEMLGN